MANLPESTRISGPFVAAAGQTLFDGGFRLIDAPGDQAGACVVFRRERDGVATDLSLTDPGAAPFSIASATENGFVLSLATPAQDGDRCWIIGRQVQKRARAHPQGGMVRTPVLEGDAEELYARAQETRRDLDRALTAPPGEAGMELPGAAARERGVVVFTPGGAMDVVRGGAGVVVGFDPASGAPVAVPARIQVDVAPTVVSSRWAAQSAAWPGEVLALQVQGWLAAGDGGAALWARVASEPLHGGKFRSQDRNVPGGGVDPDDGGWWVLAPQDGRASVRVFGARGVADDHDALMDGLTWLEATGGVLSFPAGVVNLWRPLEFPLTRGRLETQGGAVLNLNGGTGGQLKLNPGVAALPALAADVVVGDTDIEFSAPHGLVEGDAFCLWNPADYSLTTARAYYRDGLGLRVRKVVSATVVRVRGTALKSLAAADVTCWRYRGGAVHLRDLEIVPTAARDVLVWLDGMVAPRVHGLRCPQGAQNTVLELFRCPDFIVTDPALDADGGNAYGVVISNCPGGQIDGVIESSSSRHVIALGGREGDGTVPTADLMITRIIGRNDATRGLGAIDVHGGCERITYDGVTAWGVNPGGSDITLRNAVIHGRSRRDYEDGLCLYVSELAQGRHLFENVTFISEGAGEYLALLYWDLSRITGPVEIVLRNVRVQHRGPVNPATVRVIGLYVGPTAPAHNVTLRIDATCDAATLFSLVVISGLADVRDKVKVIVERAAMPSARLIVASAAANYECLVAGPGMARGYLSAGDADLVVNPRTHPANISFDTTLTANRAVTFNNAVGGPGDELTISRRAGGAFTLTVTSVTLANGTVGNVVLAQGERVRLAYAGAAAQGRFAVVGS